MNDIKYFIVLACLSVSLSSTGQIRFSEIVQESKTAKDSEASLFFIDFWATWCKPCVYASEYLGVLQKQNPDQFYVISLSEEQPDVVYRFLKKHPTDLSVAIDYKGETFAAVNSRILPYGVLINANGTELWRGSPTDFKQADLNRFLSQHSKQKDLRKVIKIQKVKEEVFKSDYMPSKDFEMKQLKNETPESLEISSRGNHTHYKGSLKSILANEKKVLVNQINIAPELNKTYEIYVRAGENALFSILDELKLEVFHSEKQGNVLQVDISNINYWDQNQIDWGKDTAHYLIDDTQIQADNVVTEDVFYQLSKVLNLPVIVANGELDEQVHDWQIHHRFYDLMLSDLEGTYGILANKTKGSYKQYSIQKKTP